MSRHFEAVEADLLAHYGVDLRQDIGMRRLRALVRGLPPGGALHREMDPEGWRWSATEDLLAALIEVVDIGNRYFYSAHAKKGSPVLKPIEVRRPQDPNLSPKPRPPRRQSSVDEIKKFAGDNVKVVND